MRPCHSAAGAVLPTCKELLDLGGELPLSASSAHSFAHKGRHEAASPTCSMCRARSVPWIPWESHTGTPLC